MVPEHVELISSEVMTIRWDDGHQSIYFVKDLRAKCPCAVCRDEKEKPQQMFNPLNVLNDNPNDFELSGWNHIGRYAISLKWSDGHDTGIYTYDYLRELCQCDSCSA